MKKAVNRIEMIGQTYNSWRVIEHSHTNGKIAYYKCECLLCNKEYTVDGRNIRSGRSKQCVNCGNIAGHNKQKGTKRVKRSYHEMRLSYLMNLKKKTATKRGLEWSLSLEQFEKLVFSNCHYTGRPPSTTVNVFKNMSLHADHLEHGIITYNGIDRVDPSKGYTIDNCVPCCYDANSAKMAMTADQFKAFIKECSNHMNKDDK